MHPKFQWGDCQMCEPQSVRGCWGPAPSLVFVNHAPKTGPPRAAKSSKKKSGLFSSPLKVSVRACVVRQNRYPRLQRLPKRNETAACLLLCAAHPGGCSRRHMHPPGPCVFTPEGLAHPGSITAIRRTGAIVGPGFLSSFSFLAASVLH